MKLPEKPLSEKRKAYTDCKDEIFYDPEDVKEAFEKLKEEINFAIIYAFSTK